MEPEKSAIFSGLPLHAFIDVSKDYPNRGRTARKILDNQGDFKTAAAKSAAFQLGSDLAMIVADVPALF